MAKNIKPNESYHHGELRTALLNEATELVKHSGTAALSMRKLGELVGVSRTALYYHFKNKDDLLSAIAEVGFKNWYTLASKIINDEQYSEMQKLTHYMQAYLQFATTNAAIYELMFGGAIWKNQASTQALKDTAYRSFQFHLTAIGQWQKLGLFSADLDTLRIAQVTWGTLHGIGKLIIDGVYVDQKNIEQLVATMIVLYTVD